MQNRYVGDVGDFAKFGLLRFLSGTTDPECKERLGVGLIWYMHYDERHGADRSKINNDGRHVGYLDLHRKNVSLYGDCDPELWAKLGHLVGQDRRCVHCAQEAKLLPEGTRYYTPLLTYVPRMPREQKQAVRECWFRNALAETCGPDVDLVCVDPDNGLADDRIMLDPPRGAKHVYMPDLQSIWGYGKSLVIYHHSNWDGRVPVQMDRVAAKLRDGLGTAPISLWFHGGTARAFFVVPQPGSAGDVIRDRVDRFLDSGWGHPKLFEKVEHDIAGIAAR